MPVENRRLADGVQLLALPDNRFKTAHLTAALLLPLQEQTASEQAILPFLLRRSCAAYPDFTALNKRLNQLYGARVSADVSRIGETQALVLRAVCIDDRFALQGEPVAAQCAALLRGMLFAPALEDGRFRMADFEQERRCLVEEIESEINEKRLYARQRCEQLLCKGEPYAVNRYGTIDGVKALSPERVTDAWKSVLETARIQLIVQGGDAEAVAEAFKEGFAAFPRRPEALGTSAVSATGAVREQTEKMAVNQCKLVMGFQTAVAEPDGDVAAMRLANALFGATPYSMLFRNVREKLSLCYYCSSSYDRLKGVMLVDSGVERDKVEQAKAEVLRQLSLLQAGEFSDEDLESARRSIGNQFGTVNDLQSTRAVWYLGQSTLPTLRTPEQAADEIAAVTKERVVAAARTIRLTAVYLLAADGEEGQTNG